MCTENFDANSDGSNFFKSNDLNLLLATPTSKNKKKRSSQGDGTSGGSSSSSNSSDARPRNLRSSGKLTTAITLDGGDSEQESAKDDSDVELVEEVFGSSGSRSSSSSSSKNCRQIITGNQTGVYANFKTHDSVRRQIANKEKETEKKLEKLNNVDQTHLLIGDSIVYRHKGVDLKDYKFVVVTFVAVVKPPNVFAVVVPVPQGERFDDTTLNFHFLTVGKVSVVRRDTPREFKGLCAVNLIEFLQDNGSPKGLSLENLCIKIAAPPPQLKRKRAAPIVNNSKLKKGDRTNKLANTQTNRAFDTDISGDELAASILRLENMMSSITKQMLEQSDNQPLVAPQQNNFDQNVMQTQWDQMRMEMNTNVQTNYANMEGKFAATFAVPQAKLDAQQNTHAAAMATTGLTHAAALKHAEDKSDAKIAEMRLELERQRADSDAREKAQRADSDAREKAFLAKEARGEERREATSAGQLSFYMNLLLQMTGQTHLSPQLQLLAEPDTLPGTQLARRQQPAVGQFQYQQQYQQQQQHQQQQAPFSQFGGRPLYPQQQQHPQQPSPSGSQSHSYPTTPNSGVSTHSTPPPQNTSGQHHHNLTPQALNQLSTPGNFNLGAPTQNANNSHNPNRSTLSTPNHTSTSTGDNHHGTSSPDLFAQFQK
jgi:hypothetical protein